MPAAPRPTTGAPCPPAFLDLAERLADAAGAAIRRHFRTPMRVEEKPDRTPVTIADREAEAAMRAILAAKAPSHGVIGEEFGTHGPDRSLIWVLDPIDGTKAFMTGKPTFGTLISLVRDGAPILGVIDQPVAGERWIGAEGRPTRFNGSPVRVRACDRLERAVLNTTSPDLFAGADLSAFRRLAAAVGLTLYGGDCYAYGLLASGFIDLVVEAGLKRHDFCALAPVVAGAGGVITDWRGAPVTLASDGRIAAAGDAVCHARARAFLSEDACSPG